MYASLTGEDPAFLEITYDYVYYLKYTKLKSFFGCRVWALKPVYRLLNPSGYIYAGKRLVYCFQKVFRADSNEKKPRNSDKSKRKKISSENLIQFFYMVKIKFERIVFF